MNNETEYRQPSTAHSLIVAAGIIGASLILSAVLLAILLIWFWHPCCCCCQRPQVLGSSVTEFSAPNPHIAGSAVNRLRGYPGQARQQAVILPAGERAAPKADNVPPRIEANAPAVPAEQGEYFYDEPAGSAPGSRPVPDWWWPNVIVGYVPAEASTAPPSSSTVVPPVEVPEPGSLAMMLVGIPLIIAITRSRPLG